MDLSEDVALVVPLPAASADAVQLRYARVLDRGTYIGLALLMASFALYVSGLVPAHVPLERLPELWHYPVAHYLTLTGAPTGWGWLARLHQGDMLGIAAIALLAGWSGACLLALLPLYRARGDRLYAWLCVVQVVVLLIAASGIVGGKGH